MRLPRHRRKEALPADAPPPGPRTPDGARTIVARRPICDHLGVICAFELLFNEAGGRDTDGSEVPAAPTAPAIVAALAELGLQEVTGGHPAWLALDRVLLRSELVDALPPESAVIRVADPGAIDDGLVAAVERLVRRGATVAVGDVVHLENADRLLRLATWSRIDLGSVGTAGFAERAGLLRPFGVHLLAEGVETPAALEECRRAGASLFRGSVFSSPRTCEPRTIPAGNASRLELIRRVNDPEVDFEELQRVVVQDVTLSYRFMRYVNSAHVGIPRDITSIREALVIMGLDRVRRWTTVLAAAGIAPSHPDLLGTALIRATMCAALAARIGTDANAAYTAGLLSVLDVLLDQPMAAILEQLPLAPEVSRALGEGDGPLGDILSTVLAYEQGEVVDRTLGAAFVTGVREAAEALASL